MNLATTWRFMSLFKSCLNCKMLKARRNVCPLKENSESTLVFSLIGLISSPRRASRTLFELKVVSCPLNLNKIETESFFLVTLGLRVVVFMKKPTEKALNASSAGLSVQNPYLIDYIILLFRIKSSSSTLY